jgi:hypothetical protein
MDYCIRSNFWKLYLIKTSFTLGESASLVKVFTLFKLEHMFFGIQSVDRVGRCTTFERSGSKPKPCSWFFNKIRTKTKTKNQAF